MRDELLWLSHVTNKPLSFLHAHLDLSQLDLVRLDSDIAKRYRDGIVRLRAGEPLAYVIGNAEFYGFEFEVNDAVLIPRSDSELLIDTTLELLGDGDGAAILEGGTGSGCLVITLALLRRHWSFTATDSSEAALEVAKKNAACHNVSSRIAFGKSNWFSEVAFDASFDAVLVNPPYVLQEEREKNDALHYEPAGALFPVDNCLDHYATIAAQAYPRVKENGYLIVECGAEQADTVISLVALQADNGFVHLGTKKDNAGHNRVVVFSKSCRG